MAYSQSYLDTAHLLLRAGFGGTPDEIQAASQAGLAATTQRLLDFQATPDNVDDDAVIDKLETALPQAAQELAELRLPLILVQVWWIYRMLATNRPLQEKMVLFWHNHFTSNDTNGTLLMQQNQLYRQFALGNFRTLAMAVSKNPEMLQYLNNAQNYKAHPNENYAREVMELFTCGRVGPGGKPNYTEDDVKASARAFSGWNMRRGEFFYNPNQHDDTAKTFMGHTGDLNGNDIIDILVSLPSTGYNICRELFRYFAYDDPEPAVMDALVSTYFDSGYELQPIVEQILTSNAFYSAEARGAVVKSPADFAIGSVRMLGLAPSFAPDQQYLFGDDPNGSPPVLPAKRAFRAYAGQQRRGGLGSPVGRLVFLDSHITNMGQTLFRPPTVKGWDGGEMWINTDTLQARARFAAALASLPDLEISGAETDAQPAIQAASFGHPGGINPSDAQKIVDAVLENIGPLQVSADVRQALIAYAEQESNANLCLRGLVSLAMATPEYQVC